MTKNKSSTTEKHLIKYLRWCEKVQQATPATIQTKTGILWNFVRDTKIAKFEDLTNKKIDRWIAYKARSCNANSIRTSIAIIVAWLRWERDMGTKLNVQIRMIVKPKPEPVTRRWYTAEEINEVISSCDELLDEIIIRLLFDTGLRIFEFQKIRVSDIYGRKIIVVGKGKKQDWVYMSDSTERKLNQWIKASGAKDYIWIKGTKYDYYDPLTIDAIRKRLRRAFARAGYPNFQPHELRHSFATDLRLKGAPLDVIQKLMRHSSLQVTERYLHNLDGDLCDTWDSIKRYSLEDNDPNDAKMVVVGSRIVELCSQR